MTKQRYPEVDKYIGAKIKEIRLARGMSQEKLGEHLGITFQQIQKYEGGKNRTSASTLLEICRILEVGLKDIMPESAEIAEKALEEIDPAALGTARKIASMLQRIEPRIARSLLNHIRALAREPGDTAE